MLRSLLFALLTLSTACGTPAGTPAPDGGVPPDMTASGMPGTTVATDRGAVTGMASGATRIFLGIPYAAPPVGALRWKAPRPAAAWSAPRDATKAGAICPQLDVQSGNYVDAASEDCLTLNVWTPAAPKAPLPVMVWVHGGGFILGAGSLSDYDGRKLSESGPVVVVSFNYRLGPLGFLAHAALTAEDPAHPGSGGWGLEDQRAALAWVHANIAGFGGDPANVTLFGESAGGISVCLHQMSPPSKGLFQRALLESSACTAPLQTRAEAEAQGATLAKAVGCTDASPPALATCLRAKAPKELLLALPLKAGFFFGPGVSWSPSVDGVNLPDQPAALLRAGKLAHVPTLAGTNADEGTIFLALAALAGQMPIATDADYRAALQAIFPPVADAVAGKYPSSSYPSPRDALAVVIGDAAFVCSTRQLVRANAAAGAPTFLYSFRHAIDFKFLGDLGAFHGSEVGFVFGTSFGGFTPISEAEKPLSQAMMGYWSRFATGGDPNGGGAPAWPSYTTAGEEHVVLDLTIGKDHGLRKEQCDFWDSLGG